MGQIAGIRVGQGDEKMKIVPKKVFGDGGGRWREVGVKGEKRRKQLMDGEG